jgi:4-amino-4-deoxy-L-arabinose transferase-like glycosyltransferase
VNYYGDANFIINALLLPLAHPDICAPLIMVALILILILFYRPNWILNNNVSLNSLSSCFTGRREVTTLIAILFVGLLIRLNGYDFHTGWFDEIASATEYGNPHNKFMDTFMDPGNPPLYYILLRSWFVLFGWSEGVGRMLSVVISTAGIATMYTFLRHHASLWAALIGALLVALNGYSLSYSHEVRSYILVFAIVPLVLDALFSFLKAPEFRHGLLFVLWGALLVNTHYFGVFIIATGFLCGG